MGLVCLVVGLDLMNIVWYMLLHKVKTQNGVLTKWIIGLLGECEIRITNSVTFCISNVFHNKYPFVLSFGITVTKRILGGDLAGCHK